MIGRIKIYPWEKEIRIDLSNWKLKKGDNVIIKNTDTDGEMEAVEILDAAENIAGASTLCGSAVIVRVAAASDIDAVNNYNLKKEEALNFAKKQAKIYSLDIKFIDVQYSFDGSRITFGFVSAQRVDFRELVKALSRHFQKSIKMVQVGSRDEARNFGGVGGCGRQLCCASFLKKIESVTLNDAKIQRMDQRGSARLSGICGRLKCCLAFESKTYEELNASMPFMNKEVETKKGKGRVIDIYVLEKKVKVLYADNTYNFLEIGEIKIIDSVK
ncbi:hypothetical protein KKE99_04895 [Patescibacteria group bacterium]|nr:hypothetical protein [Patescibacteria group bacterium]